MWSGCLMLSTPVRFKAETPYFHCKPDLCLLEALLSPAPASAKNSEEQEHKESDWSGRDTPNEQKYPSELFVPSPCCVSIFQLFLFSCC